MSLSALDRLARVKEVVDTAGRARVTDLAADLGVSEMTIRRDLDDLAADGLVRRVRGGAVAVGPQPFAERFARHGRAKERIAAKLLDLVGEGGAIGLDASSTLQRMAVRLGPVPDLTVVTNGLDTFTALTGRSGVTALLTGGELDDRTGSLVGPVATRAAGDLLLRRFFTSAAAVDPVQGSTEATLEDGEVKRSLAAASAEVILAVDSSKLGQRAPAATFRPEQVTLLVTELDPDDARLDPYRDRWRIR